MRSWVVIFVGAGSFGEEGGSPMIRFACPACGKVYKAEDEHAGRKTACKKCGAIVVIPEAAVREVLYGTALPPEGEVEASPEPEPVRPGSVPSPPRPPAPAFPIAFDFDNAQPSEVKPRRGDREPEPEDDDSPPGRSRESYDLEPDDEPPIYPRSRRTKMGQANRIVAGVGAAMLLIGQFLPMVNTPFGLSMSFVDLPWKAVTVGLNAAAEAEERRGEPRQQRLPPRRDRSDQKTDDAPAIVTAVVLIGILYPGCIFAMVAIAFFQICSGNSRGVFTMIGGLSLSATLGYGIALLALSAQKDFRIVMVFTSPGFGWAVVLIGALALTGSGMIRSDSRK